jgi:hypothetical protein
MQRPCECPRAETAVARGTLEEPVVRFDLVKRGIVLICVAASLAACGPQSRASSGASGGSSSPCLTAAQPVVTPTESADSGAADALSADASPFDPSVCEPPDAASPTDSASDAACPTAPPATQPQVLAGEVRRVRSTCGVCGGAPPLVGGVPDETTIQLDIELPFRNEEQLAYCSGELYAPGTPVYQHFLTPDQFAALYGPTACDYEAVIAWVESHGLVVTAQFPDHMMLEVEGTAAAINAALHVRIDYYLRRDGSLFFAPDRDPSLDLAIPISSIVGLDNCDVATPI